MIKKMLISLLVLSILIYIIKSKHTPIIIKNNVKSFLVQTAISILGFIIPWLIYGQIYENTSSIIIYNIPSTGQESLIRLTKEAYIFQLTVKAICMILYIIFGMSLTRQKSKIKNFLSLFICYIVLVIINQKIFPLYFENIYVWVPYIFISKSSHIALQRATPLIYNTVFFVLLFVPTLFMWIGMELKNLYDIK